MKNIPVGSFPCKCGKTHTNPTRIMIYDEDGLEQLPKILTDITTRRVVYLFADHRTYNVAGRRAETSLQKAGWSVKTIIIPDTDQGFPSCDDLTFEKIKPMVKNPDILLAVGSGVINDLTKWIAFDLNKPYAVLATAASMNGYTAANVAPSLKGVKSIVYAQAPVAVLSVPSIIENAPFELTAAGLGDVLAKPISTADWLMNHILFNEYFCPQIAEMITAIEPSYLNHPEDVRDRKPQAIAALYQALIYSGLAMTLVGTSAPASGGEHMLSHTLDMMSSLDGVPHDLHGRQVGLGTIFAAALYDRIFQIESPKIFPMPVDIDRQFWGKLTSSVSEQYAAKQPHLKIMQEKLSTPAAWNDFLTAVKTKIRSPKEIKNCLQRAYVARCFADIHCSRDRLRLAVLHMHEIRKRCTVVDLAWTLGILPNAADDLIDQWLTP
ncbi:MAG: iron-containing alcohol dehydrogenase [Phycisphaerae bacterium]